MPSIRHLAARQPRRQHYPAADSTAVFTFSTLADYTGAHERALQRHSLPRLRAPAGTRMRLVNLPTKLTFSTGNEKYLGNVFDGALFFQDDWKANKFLTLSGGLRWESQNHIADHSDWGPRVAFAYALDGHKKNTVSKTVVRGGFGFFFDRFQIGSLMGLERNHVTTNPSQQQYVITNPTCFDPVSLANVNLATCNNSVTPTLQTQQFQSLMPTTTRPTTSSLEPAWSASSPRFPRSRSLICTPTACIKSPRATPTLICPATTPSTPAGRPQSPRRGPTQASAPSMKFFPRPSSSRTS